MAHAESWSARQNRWMHRLHARLSTLARPATAFVSQPEPRTIGSFARGKQLLAGNFLFAGTLAEAPGRSIWDLGVNDPAFEAELHGFAWLDDLAAVGDASARLAAQDWLVAWIGRYGGGRGPGWTPDLTGRRLIRWINHAILLLRGQEADVSRAFFRSLAQQTNFLSRRWSSAQRGLPRFEALTGTIYAGLALEGMDSRVDPAVAALARDCAREIDAEGGVPTRNPEELLEVFTLLTWAASALSDAGRIAPPEHIAAIERIAPTLRALRHADGGLARFHGGGRGADGRLDAELAASGVRAGPPLGLAMGFARLSAGRTTVILDAAPPPTGPASFNAHASTLAFELTSGRRPVIVNCGAGASFGTTWRQAGRATPSHSALGLEGYSSARLGPSRRIGGQLMELLVDAPTRVPSERSRTHLAIKVEAGHNGYVESHGLTHARTLELGADGRSLRGEDVLVALDPPDRSRFDAAVDATGLQGLAYSARFHLHPDVEASLDLGGTAVSLALKSGEVWVFRHEGPVRLALEASVYLEKGRLKPRAARQIVLMGRAIDYTTHIRWSFAKAQDTPVSVRDFARPARAPA